MKSTELGLKDLLTVSPNDALVRFMQQRVLIFDDLAMGLLRKELIDTLGLQGARKVLTHFGYVHGWRMAEMLQNEFAEIVSDGHGGDLIYQMFGLLSTCDRKESTGEDGEMLIESSHLHSYEADQHIGVLGLSHTPVCWSLVGFASGFETHRFGRDVFFIEDHCCATGADCCHIVGRFREDWGEELEPHLQYFETADADSMLTRLTAKFHDLEKRLEEKQQELALLDNAEPFPGMVVRSQSMRTLMEVARRVAQVDSSILVTGNSGVGKEQVSRYIHNSSGRKDHPFITVNCGALSETLLESELFGHAKGAFTGANSDRVGLFEEANGGTLFLDEIGETSLNMQVKLLRALQEREVKRVGENLSRPFDVRIIAATNRDLEKEVEAGRFRLDLLYRLKVIELDIPPLQERGEDILPLANQFLHKFKREMHRNITGLSKGAVQRLIDYHWPGNIRELHNAMERSVALCQGEWIEPEDLPHEVAEAVPKPKNAVQVRPMKEVERDYILSALNACNGDKQLTAKTLQVGVATLYRKLKEYGVQ